MFDVGFSELVLIALIALIVLGPKRLPEVARTAGRWMAKLRHFISSVKHDFDAEMRNAEIMELQKLKQELDDTRRAMQDASGHIIQRIGDLPSDGDISNPTPKAAPAPTIAPLTEPPTPKKKHAKTARAKKPKVVSPNESSNEPSNGATRSKRTKPA